MKQRRARQIGIGRASSFALSPVKHPIAVLVLQI